MLQITGRLNYLPPPAAGQTLPHCSPREERSGPSGHAGNLVHQLLPRWDTRHAALRPVHAPLHRLLPAGQTLIPARNTEGDHNMTGNNQMIYGETVFRETWSPMASTSPIMVPVWTTTLVPLFGESQEPTDSTPSTSSSIRVTPPVSYWVTLMFLSDHPESFVSNLFHLHPTQELAWCRVTSWSQLSHSIPSERTCTTRYPHVSSPSSM